jgi:hypothetical protein
VTHINDFFDSTIPNPAFSKQTLLTRLVFYPSSSRNLALLRKKSGTRRLRRIRLVTRRK